MKKRITLLIVYLCLVCFYPISAGAGMMPAPVIDNDWEPKYAYQDEGGKVAAGVINDIQVQYEHYMAQAKLYDSIIFFLKIAVTILGLTSAIILALS